MGPREYLGDKFKEAKIMTVHCQYIFENLNNVHKNITKFKKKVDCNNINIRSKNKLVGLFTRLHKISNSFKDGRSPSPKTSTSRSNSRGTTSKDNTPKVGRKDSISALATKTRKESGSSHASTDTPSIKSEKEYDRRRDSRDSNASGPRDNSISRKSISQRDRPPKSKVNSAWDSPLIDEDSSSRRGRRRTNTSTPPATTPAKRRRM
ncbi:jg11046 [Pararge aegeria aegeria]|uniref:Jg11046 protein n=1 Tax=Pararge aegeria aegeria TaxID=348720 RepID=A0A8S4R9D1_9NEOP|nr:jg11046 [Pararge aegeria aegeria]